MHHSRIRVGVWYEMRAGRPRLVTHVHWEDCEDPYWCDSNRVRWRRDAPRIDCREQLVGECTLEAFVQQAVRVMSC